MYAEATQRVKIQISKSKWIINLPQFGHNNYFIPPVIGNSGGFSVSCGIIHLRENPHFMFVEVA